MCLITNQKRLKLAKEDIVVYKAVHVSPDNVHYFNAARNRSLLMSPKNYRYLSYYQLEDIDKDCVEGGRVYKSEGYLKRRKIGPEPHNLYMYGAGLIHTFKYFDDAIKTINYVPYEQSVDIVYKCFIPKWTRYVFGDDDYCFSTYASKRIVFIEPMWFGGIAKEWREKLMSVNK